MDAAALARGLADLGLDLDADQQLKLLAYAALLSRWNQAYNLISRQDQHRLLSRHLLDSLAILPWLDGAPAGPVADLGSGGGLPGIPLAIARPERPMTLIDRSARKTRFLEQCRIELGLTGLSVVTSDLAHYRPAQPFATLVSRALDTPARLWPRVSPLLMAGGRALLQAGPEAADASFRGIAAARFETLVVPGLDHPHYLWVVDKCTDGAASSVGDG
jgi:16S rRNA (guanine527-N7)-methyltransferase